MGDDRELQIGIEDFSRPQARELIGLHLRGMHASSPPGHVFALDLSGLTSDDVTAFSAWYGERIAGIAALKDLGGAAGELKSMRTHPDLLRRGVAGALLEHIIAVARGRGMRLLSLETGSGATFEPALALYRRRGFRDGEAFGDYRRSDFNQFLHLPL